MVAENKPSAPSHLVESLEIEAVRKKSQEPRRSVQFRLQLVLVQKPAKPRVVVQQEEAEESEADLE